MRTRILVVVVLLAIVLPLALFAIAQMEGPATAPYPWNFRQSKSPLARYLQLETLDWRLKESILTFTVSEWNKAEVPDKGENVYVRGDVSKPYILDFQTFKITYAGDSYELPLSEAQHFILLLLDLNNETTSLARGIKEKRDAGP